MRIPCSTYRLQFNSSFRFSDAKSIVSYLSELGISDIYASPIFKAHTGSIHGYDVTDPTSLNPEIGTIEDFNSLLGEIAKFNTGWLQDIVPNHMAFSGENRFLMDLFENGPYSQYYDFFDIDWNQAYESMKGRLLAPFLGKSYAESLQQKEIKIEYDENGFAVTYHCLKFLLNIESYPLILSPNLEQLKEELGTDHPDFIKLVGILYTLKAFPCQKLTNERQNQVRFVKGILWELYRKNTKIRRLISRNLSELNGEGDSQDLNPIDSLLREQFFRLSFWKVASEEINYRRFFSINELISLHMEDPQVFRLSHSLILKLLKERIFTGLRIDHIDGLYDPLNYLEMLEQASEGSYTTVEKILALNEELPSSWPVQGTTGYEFMNFLNFIFIEQENGPEFDRIYTSFIGNGTDYENLVYDKKKIIIERFMTGDVDNLAHLLKRISSRDRGGGDITLYGLKRALSEVLTCFPVYRTYVDSKTFSDTDRAFIREALERARKLNPDLRYELNYLAKYLLLDYEAYSSEEEKKEWLHFIMRFQQFSGPLMAKGFEDTTLYVFNRLISQNEVGGEPFSFGIPLERFHAFNGARFKNRPYAMSATSTHDTKRGEDVRARINVLSEIPLEWEDNLRSWRLSNRKNKREVDGKEVPSPNDEYFLYQTLLGAYPFDEAQEVEEFTERMKQYMIKAIREAKVHTGWIEPDNRYEEGCLEFIESILSPGAQNDFLPDFLSFQRKIAYYGILNSLSQVLIKITSPGVPDFYQGTELWELSLVDPDNRRPVAYERRKELLESIKQNEGSRQFIENILAAPQDGRLKMFLTRKALQARKKYRQTFEKGAYIPLEAKGQYKEHVVAFARAGAETWAVTIVPRFSTALVRQGRYPLGSDVWQDTRVILPGEAPGEWKSTILAQDIASGDSIPVALALSRFPVALLVNPKEY